MDLTGEAKCPYCGATVEFQVKHEQDQTVELCVKCDKWFVADSSVVIEVVAHKVDSMNKETDEGLHDA